MGAYIINIPDTVDTIIYINIGDVYDGKTYIASQRVEDLTPYTKPDMEQAQKEAYQKGYSEGCDAKFRRLTGSEYQRGLSDAWEAARKIIHMPEGDLLNLFTECYSAVCTSVQVFLKYGASECIEKIRAYEQEKGKIQVGDEIETPSGLKGYVVNFTDDELVHYVSSEGRFGTIGMSAVLKTGRHFPEIAEVLQKMKES